MNKQEASPRSPSSKRQNSNSKYGISIDNPLSNPYCSVFKQSKSILGECPTEFSKSPEAGLAISNEMHRAYYQLGRPKLFANTIENGITKEIEVRD